MRISGLEREEQALLLAAAVGGEPGAPALCRVLGEPAARVRAALQDLTCLASDERRRRLALLGRSLFSPVSSALARVHPSWIRARLESEPARVAVLVTEAFPPGVRAGAGSFHSASAAAPDAAVGAALIRAVLGDLPWLPPAAERPGPPAGLEELLTWSHDRMLRLVGRLGLPDTRARVAADPRAAHVGAQVLGGGLSAQLRAALALLLPIEVGRSLMAPPVSLDAQSVLALVRRAAQALAAEEGCPT